MVTPVLMLMNMKGGVGKTTLAVELSRALAWQYRKRVLLIDYDPQANASFAFLDTDRYFEYLDDGRNLASCLMPNFSDSDPFSVVGNTSPAAVNVGDYSVSVRRWPRRAAGLDLVPGALALMRLALNVLSPNTERRLLARWNGLIASAKETFDCVVIDCHPAGSFFTKSALLASNAVIVPVTSDAFAATGLNMMRQNMEMWQSSGGAKEFLVIFNDANQAWDESVELEIRENDRFADHCLSSRLPYSRLFRNIARRHKTAVEQPVANRYKVGGNVLSVSQELVDSLRELSLLDSTW